MSKPTHYEKPLQGRHGVVAKKILLALSTPLVVATTPFSTTTNWAKNAEDNLDALEDFLFPPDEEIDENKIRRSLYSLKNREYIKYIYSKDKTEIRFELTKKGKEIVQGYQVDDLRISKKQKWDGKWRFIVFDIPEKQRYCRDALRGKLETLEFFRIQQSVYLFPYSCEKEIDLLCEYFEIRRHVLIFTGNINRDFGVKRHFQKLGFFLRIK
ncbi:MAG: hypothetical protein A2728_02495 [Candidatus Spechtbacteria bacterium RIFCSPHIGHO2_01_FULL_38_11]|nr:MAG: hypothetical protein A2728_02495 [Candidatus Spechtbacteria bacterium RIFCSPHIGHO2_01_FULL_38_11]OGZ59201.1 MAG: hypothetical protein A3E58_00080 [Candidatus Spechtbacteria bacterium RIFCSPHIGHO2_12_FULL_38_30]